MRGSIANIFLRGITLLSKFLFVLFLGKYALTAETLGIYGIFATSISFLIYLLGFDFYVFNSRELLKDNEDRNAKVLNQFVFHLSLYFIIVPVAIIVIFGNGFLESSYILLFIVILVLEHLGQELYRLLTVFESSVQANLLVFIRSAFWIWIVLFSYFYFSGEIDLNRCFLYWLLSSLLSLILGLYFLSKHISISPLKKVDVKWIFLGIKNSSYFFIASLSFQVIQFSDRYILDFYLGKSAVGVYTTYGQFINAIDVFTFSAVTMIVYPKLIKNSKNPELYNGIRKDFSKKLMFLTIFLIIGTVVVSPRIFELLGKESFTDNLASFQVLIAGVFCLIVSNIYHYDLFVKKQDKILLVISLFAMMFNIVFNFILIPRFNMLGAALSTFIAFFVMLILKMYYSNKTKLILQ